MKPLLFGPAGRPLYGVVHEPEGAPKTVGAIVCHPLPYEYARLRWTHRILADLLAREGFLSMRFDWSGTGDSNGSLDSVGLDTWVEDLGLAIAELRDAHEVSRVVVIAQGLAAAITAHASARVPAVDDLVLVDPVVRGQDHLRWLRLNDHLPFGGGPNELLGQPLSSSLARDLAAIDLSTTPIRCAGKRLGLETEQSRAVAALLGHLAAPGREVAHRVVTAAADPTPGALDEVLVLPALPREMARLISEVIA